MNIKLQRKHWIAVVAAAAIISIIITAAAILVPRSLVPRAHTAHAYYVDNSGADGDGSFATPWNNIAGHVTDLAAGDTMHVRGDAALPGRIYNEHIDTSVGCADGTSAKPITLRPYLDEHVILKSSEVETVRLWNVDHWVLDGFTLDRDDIGGYGIYIRHGAHNTVRNCTIYDGADEGIHLYQTDYNLIEGCVIYDFFAGAGTDAQGIGIFDSSHNTVRNCTIYDIRGDCVHVMPINEAMSGNVIEDSHLYTTHGGCSENAIDIKVGNAIVRRNVMHGFRYCDGCCGGSGSQGAAVVVHLEALGVVIEDNTIYDCTQGIRVLDDHAVLIQRNLIYDLVAEEGHLSAGLIFHSCWADAGVYNNTFSALPDHLFYLSSTARNITFRNNLFHDTGSITIEAGGTCDTDHSGWFSAAVRIEGPNDIVGDDPLLTADFRLTEDSPARNAGEGGIDLGAFPYAPNGQTATPTAASPLPTPTQWWEHCTIWPTYPVQPTYTPRPPPTCRPCPPSPTPYPTGTPYPPQPAMRGGQLPEIGGMQ